jgi:hypothetical protein
MTQPHTYPRRILVAVSGLSPQILTETLYGLAVANQPAFIPTEIHLITTVEGANRAQLNLLHPKDGHFGPLCDEYQLGHIEFSDQHIHIIKDTDGTPLDDIRTPQQNAAAADFITETIRTLTEDEQAALHVSVMPYLCLDASKTVYPMSWSLKIMKAIRNFITPLWKANSFKPEVKNPSRLIHLKPPSSWRKFPLSVCVRIYPPNY